VRDDEEEVPVSSLHPGVHVRAAHGQTRAVVLVLHGGKEHSHEASEPMHLSSRRMRPFARALHRQGADHGVAVWSVKYRVRGWNGADMSPVHDARWALAEVRARHGDVPVVLVGHSMGGRTAARVLGDPNVVAMVGLAPWLPDEPVEVARDREVLIAHGVVDRWTSPRESRRWAEAARPLARSVTYVRVRRSGHFLLRRARLWTDLTVGFALRNLGLDPSVGRSATKALAEAAAGTSTVTV
jgi:pimeloyl-ACP methyl ester carboxylesterase